MNSGLLRSTVHRFVPVSDEIWTASAPFFRQKDYAAKEYFLRQGDICRHIGFILSGYTRLFYLADGNEVTKDFNTEGSFCGSYASFSTAQPSGFNVVCMEPLSALLISHHDLMTLVERYPEWQKFLRICMEHMFISKENREAMFLLSSPKERYDELMQQRPDWINRIPLKYLASYLGMAPETLSRIRKLK